VEAGDESLVASSPHHPRKAQVFNPTETDERRYLEEVRDKIAEALDKLGRRVRGYARDAREQKEQMWEQRGEMDQEEKIATRQTIFETVMTGKAAHDAQRRMQKLYVTPYFGRFDFLREGALGDPVPYYVGIHSFTDEELQKVVIFDWRAPISSVFYEFELGAARYKAPVGVVRGEVSLKRQYRIKYGRMEFMLESGLNIMDDILQEELSRTADERMKTIVATIQRDQNAIVRNTEAEVLIVQGVAGSGKTSIALHRIAFLLYRYRKSLSSRDFLIISPNKVFSDYISNVLPELGEEQIQETVMESLAERVLDEEFSYQGAADQAEILATNPSPDFLERVRVKGTAQFVKDLDRYIEQVEERQFQGVDLPVRDRVIPAHFLTQTFDERPWEALSDRLSWVAQCAVDKARRDWRMDLTGRERGEVQAEVRKMGRRSGLKTLYREFFRWLGAPHLFRPPTNLDLEYCDLFPIIYLKLRLERGHKAYAMVKHLVVDEMQDYTPIQYAVINRLFDCKKTILGDINQSLNTYIETNADTIANQFSSTEIVKLCKSYRSSYEITRFAQQISRDEDLVPIERHGEAPSVVVCDSEAEELVAIKRAIGRFSELGRSSMGIICKTPAQAQALHGALSCEAADIHLLTPNSAAFVHGVVVCSVQLAKGLEFDYVVVPGAGVENYRTENDRKSLYVACTRAMHHLVLTSVGPVTALVPA